MNLAIIGYGKMGKMIEQLATAKGHTIGLIIDINNPGDLNAENLKNIDCAIEPHELTFETCKKMSRLEPFGTDNPEPKLLLKNVTIKSIKPVGKSGEHLQLPIQYGDKSVGAIAFRFGKHIDKINPAIPHDIVCNMEINEWNGYRKLQLRVVDLKPSG